MGQEILKHVIFRYKYTRGSHLVASVVDVLDLVLEELLGRLGELDGVADLLGRQKDIRVHELGELSNSRVAAHGGSGDLFKNINKENKSPRE